MPICVRIEVVAFGEMDEEYDSFEFFALSFMMFLWFVVVPLWCGWLLWPK